MCRKGTGGGWILAKKEEGSLTLLPQLEPYMVLGLGKTKTSVMIDVSSPNAICAQPSCQPLLGGLPGHLVQYRSQVNSTSKAENLLETTIRIISSSCCPRHRKTRTQCLSETFVLSMHSFIWGQSFTKRYSKYSGSPGLKNIAASLWYPFNLGLTHLLVYWHSFSDI